MTTRIGVDEAGLGPKLGPLVLAAMATRGPHDLRSALVGAVGLPGSKPPLLEVGDSKKIHTGTRKLARLERTVLATVMWAYGLDTIPATAAEVVGLVAGAPPDERRAPWYADLHETLPVAAERDVIITAARNLTRIAGRAGVRCTAYRADLISAATLNRELVAECELEGSKNTWVVQRTLSLVRTLLDATDRTRPVVVQCDKAGGRDAYAGALNRTFPSHAVTELERSRTHSRYVLDSLFEPSAKVEIGFVMRGDSLDPRISWGSCLAKYVRELVMRGFNRYWATQIHDLRPTAGYPEDARRFIAEVDAAAARAGLAADRWIRRR